MKKILKLSSLVIIFMLSIISLSFSSQTYAADACAQYTDVAESDWYCEKLEFLLEHGILDARRDKFHPNTQLNRAEALKILYEAAGERTKSYPLRIFDIPNAWFLKYFYTAYGEKYIVPEKEKFKPAESITKAEFLLLFMKIFEIDKGGSTGCGLDVIVLNTWVKGLSLESKQYLCEAKRLNFALSFTGSFISRADAMTVLSNALQSD